MMNGKRNLGEVRRDHIDHWKSENVKEEVVLWIVAISEFQLSTSNEVAMEKSLGNIAGKITLDLPKVIPVCSFGQFTVLAALQ